MDINVTHTTDGYAKLREHDFAALLARVAELEKVLGGAYSALKIALKCNHFTNDEYAHIGEWTDEIHAALLELEKAVQ